MRPSPLSYANRPRCETLAVAHIANSTLKARLRPLRRRTIRYNEENSRAGATHREHQSNSMENKTPPGRVVICGGGIIGASVAYYLTKLGISSTVVEREEIACAASGKAAGFLAVDWNDSSALGPLSRKSFELHRQLAQELETDIGYRPLTTLQVAAQAKQGGAAKKLRAPTPAWLDGPIISAMTLGSQSTTAQVHPKLLTQALFRYAESKGTTLFKGTVNGIRLSSERAIEGVCVDKEVLPAETVVVALGPWTSQAVAQWLPVPDVSGQKYHSIVLKPPNATSADAAFTTTVTQNGASVDVEIYPRPDGTVYVCGEAGEVGPVPEAQCDITVEEDRCSRIHNIAGGLSSNLKEATAVAQQACYLPWAADGLPLMGKLPGIQGAYIATGHGCWGILNGPATGLALAELIVHGHTNTVNISKYDSRRFFGR